jgi:hypothetical protein
MADYEEGVPGFGVSEELNLNTPEYVTLLESLNQQITAKCAFASLVFKRKRDYFDLEEAYVSFTKPVNNVNDYLLCVMLKGTCVSSIQVSIVTEQNGQKVANIDSATLKPFEGKGYNSLLRAGTVLILNPLGVNSIRSLAKNPLSAILQKKLGAVEVGEGSVKQTMLDVKSPANQATARTEFNKKVETITPEGGCYDYDTAVLQPLNTSVNSFVDPKRDETYKGGRRKRRKTKRRKHKRRH